MIENATKYTSKQANDSGIISYTAEENETWQILYQRQCDIIKARACDAFIQGLDALKMPNDRIPQLSEVTEALQKSTGWSVAQVPALIPYDRFFTLLSQKEFPGATFIRRREELDYLQEPDIFHELYGHCPMLTHEPFANFVELYGKLALSLGKPYFKLLARLFWFTVEFGLIKTSDGIRCYGAGILSSKSETIYAIEDTFPKREPFDLLTVLRTPYRVDQIQGVYYVIESFESLYRIIECDLAKAIQEAKAMNELELIEVNKGADKDEWSTC